MHLVLQTKKVNWIMIPGDLIKRIFIKPLKHSEEYQAKIQNSLDMP